MKLTPQQRDIFLKCAEELNELSLELLHAVNKIDKNNRKAIKSEIADVKKQLDKLVNIALPQ